jgi:hypothetical protein
MEEACTHIKNITKKVCTLHFTMFKNKYLGECAAIHKRHAHALPLAAFKCPIAQTLVT